MKRIALFFFLPLSAFAAQIPVGTDGINNVSYEDTSIKATVVGTKLISVVEVPTVKRGYDYRIVSVEVSCNIELLRPLTSTYFKDGNQVKELKSNSQLSPYGVYSSYSMDYTIRKIACSR